MYDKGEGGDEKCDVTNVTSKYATLNKYKQHVLRSTVIVIAI